MPYLDLATEGDPVERAAWPAFLRMEFPQYQQFWRLFVVGLTRRPEGIDFRSQDQLDRIGRPSWHVTVAQLHYTMLLHLVRVFEIRRGLIANRDLFIEAITRLHSATDVAYELLGRSVLPGGEAEPWSEEAGQSARRRWIRHDEPATHHLKDLRQYRNALVHGRVRPEFRARVGIDGLGEIEALCYPKFLALDNVADWRRAALTDFAPADALVEEGWQSVLAYLRDSWDHTLLPWSKDNVPATREDADAERGEVVHEGGFGGSAGSAGRPQYRGGSVTWEEGRSDAPS